MNVLRTPPSRPSPYSWREDNGCPDEPEGKPGYDIIDSLISAPTLAHLLIGGKFYKDGAKVAEAELAQRPPLQDLPNVKMDKPLAIVPGWTTRPEKFQHFVDKLLASGQNGERAYYVKNGQFFSDPEHSKPATPDKNARVFVTAFEERNTSPEINAPQVARNLEAIQKATGVQRLDVEAYSMGGLSVRKYLDNGGDAIGNLAIVGTPNQGTQFAVLAGKIIKRDIQWAMSLAGLVPGDLGAMEFMAAGSPKLKELNERWPEQRKQVDRAEVIGAGGFSTPSPGWRPFRSGDGMVEAKSVPLPDIPVHLLEGSAYLHHGSMVHDSGVFRELSRFFNWHSAEGNGSRAANPNPE